MDSLALMIRQSEFDQIIAHLGPGYARPRAVVVTGPAGVGKSYLVEQAARRLESSGVSACLIDDIDLVPAEDTLARLAELAGAPEVPLLVAGREIAAEAMEFIDRRFDRRILPLSTIDEVGMVREVAEALGIPALSLRVIPVLVEGGGNVRNIVDIASAGRLPDWGAERFLGRLQRYPRLSAWLAARLRAASLERGRLVSNIDRRHGSADDLLALALESLARGDLELSVQMAERADRLARDAQDAWLATYAAIIAAAARGTRGESMAVQSLGALEVDAAVRGYDELAAIALYELVNVFVAIGEFAMAESACRRGIDVADASGSTMTSIALRSMLAELEGGASAATLAMLEEVRQYATQVGFDLAAVAVSQQLSERYLAAGQADRARELAEDAFLRLPDTASMFERVHGARAVAHTRAATGAVDAALEVLATPDDWRRQQPCGIEYLVGVSAARLLTRQSAPAEAFGPWLALANEMAEVAMGPVAAAAAEIEARQHLAAERVADAHRLVTIARQGWDDGQLPEERMAMEDLVRQVDAAAGELDPLSRREREVADHVASGMTNAQIALALHLSQRTVEHHVAAVLRKLELPSRKALVAAHRGELATR